MVQNQNIKPQNKIIISSKNQHLSLGYFRTLKSDRFGEWPIVRWWYTKKKGQTIEETIDNDLDWFLWAVTEFQNVTPHQAEYFHKKTGMRLNPIVIQNVEPYNYEPGDPEPLYMDICTSQNLESVLLKYRGKQLDLF